MIEKIQKLRACYNELFGDSFINSCFVESALTHNCLIEIKDKEDEIILSANKEGMLYLVGKLIELCEQNKEWSHYHLDEAGMASKCNKPLIISLVNTSTKCEVSTNG